MINLQSEFLSFHNTIKLDDENAVLREKRDILLNKLKEKITSDAPQYTPFNQGSYAMNTGIIPADSDYDIDVGLKFDMTTDDCSDPVEAKKWIRDALDGHTKSVEIRRSCVTVTYQKEGEPLYHIDFSIYSANNPDNFLYIAKGKENSKTEYKYWEIADPQGLVETINSKFQNEDRYQFKRVIRYLKKWKDYNFKTSGSSAPTGVALTILAYNNFNSVFTFDSISLQNKYNDLTALYNLIRSIISLFSFQYDEISESMCHTISTKLVVQPYDELFDKMTKLQMEALYIKLVSLESDLKRACDAEKKHEACKILIKQFGEDFPLAFDKSTVGTSDSANVGL